MERILIKLAIIQFLFLIIAQSIILHSSAAPYLVKVIQYEGVYRGSELLDYIETFDQMK